MVSKVLKTAKQESARASRKNGDLPLPDEDGQAISGAECDSSGGVSIG
jgi:hypothetical protein